MNKFRFAAPWGSYPTSFFTPENVRVGHSFVVVSAPQEGLHNETHASCLPAGYGAVELHFPRNDPVCQMHSGAVYVTSVDDR